MISIGSVFGEHFWSVSQRIHRFHFVVDCPLYENIRVKFFDKVIDLCPNFRYMDTSSKFVWLFTNEHDDWNDWRHTCKHTHNLCSVTARPDQSLSNTTINQFIFNITCIITLIIYVPLYLCMSPIISIIVLNRLPLVGP
jgi:hypothetical protein